MMVEGVHNGSQGPLLHEISELGKFPASWNGIPIVIYHPEEDGEPVSANSPDIVDNMVVGRVYNTEVEGKKLKAEAWFDEEQLNTVSPETLQDINDGKLIEVSLGMFTENEMVEGTWGKEEYKGIAHNHRPDHLAILPDQKGACSTEDGAGLGANQKNKDMERTKKPINEMLTAVNMAGYAVNKIGVHSEDVNYQQRINMANDALRKLDVNVYNYLEELYDTYLIYCKSGLGEYKMYKQEYKIESGKVEFVGAPVEVHRKVDYVVNSLTRTKFSINNKSKEEQKMADEKSPVVKKVTDLIANNQGFTEDDRTMLEALTEPQLDKLFKKKEEEKKPPETNKEEKKEEKKAEVSPLSNEDQAALAYGKKQLKERREKMIKGIQDNTEKGTWDEVTLTTMSEEVLERVYKSVVKEEDEEKGGHYIAGKVNANLSKVKEGLYPAGVKMEEK
jgi:hypothetical protein